MNKRYFLFLSGICMVSLLFAACSNQGQMNSQSIKLEPYGTEIIEQTPPAVVEPQASPSGTTQPQVKGNIMTSATLKTSKGDIELVFYPDDAPKTVANFTTHAQNKYYDNLTFHRVEPGFVIQGGDPNGNGTGGKSIYGATFEDELNPATQSYKDGYKEGVLAMANRGPNTNGSQFFIMLDDNPTLPKNYTIFGKVTKGMDVVKKIAVGDKILSISVK